MQPNPTPVIFVYGFKGSTRDYRPLVNWLEARGIGPCHEFSYDSAARVSLTQAASRLAEYVAEILKHNPTPRPPVLVGQSQGGIIAAHYLESLGGKEHIHTCVTMCTPFQGTLIAYTMNRIGIREMRPASPLLASIGESARHSSVKYYGVWNPLDLSVIPSWSANPTFLTESLMVVSPLHQTTFWAPATKRFVARIVSDGSGAGTFPA